MSEQRNRIVFDIETQRTFDEVGGVENRHKLGVSYVGVYSYSQENHKLERTAAFRGNRRSEERGDL